MRLSALIPALVVAALASGCVIVPTEVGLGGGGVLITDTTTVVGGGRNGDVIITDTSIRIGGTGRVVRPEPVEVRPGPTSTQGVANPIIDSFTPAINDVVPGQPIVFTVVAHDPRGRSLQFNWASTGGVLSSTSGRVASWVPPEKPGTYTVTVIISNDQGGVVTGNLNMVVQGAAPTPAPATPAPATPAPAVTAAPTPVPTVAPTQAPVQNPETSGVGGVVKDDTGLVAGATVTLSDDKGFSQTRTTGADGRYEFENAPPNTRLVISATKAGYIERIRTIFTLKGARTQWDFEASFALEKI